MQKALTGVVLLLTTVSVHAQTWLYTPSNIAYFNYTGNKVGIGTTTPTNPLDVYTAGSSVDDHNTINIQNPSGSDWANVQLALTSGNSTAGTGTSLIFSQRQGNTNGSNLSFWTTNNSGAPGTRMLITSDGTVGIACVPEYKLDVYTTAANDGVKVTTPSGRVLLHGNNLGLYAYNGLTQQGDGGIIYGNSSDVVNFGFVIAPWNNTLSGIRMDNNGNVGIGTYHTSDASYKLFVETGIRTRKIVVDQTAWPDYVFHPDYPLPSLPSVAAYIKANQHLPDMPSADSVAKNGVDLGSNQTQLLKKIEELTLYTIHQDETIRQQAKKLEGLEQAVQALQKPSKPKVANTRKMK